MSASSTRWDPRQYDRYAAERARPFDDLVNRVVAHRDAAGTPDPARVLDVGCGTGSQTATLHERWLTARVEGIDSSPEMIGKACSLSRDGLSFAVADAAAYEPDAPLDVVVSNAMLQWVPDHLPLLSRMAGWLAPGGILAVQVPDNFTGPSHTAVRELRESARWRDRVGSGADRHLAVETPATYLQTLAAAGLEPDVWETTYQHLLPGDDAVLEWVKGTALRPVLTALEGDPGAREDFLSELGARLAAAYPRGPYGTVFPFPRIFAVARRP